MILAKPFAILKLLVDRDHEVYDYMKSGNQLGPGKQLSGNYGVNNT
jgi:hypothetical protein